MTEKQAILIAKEARQEGYEEALSRVRTAIKMVEMNIPDCEIVKKTELPPIIVHALIKD